MGNKKLIPLCYLISVFGLFWKCARIGERLSPYVSICCVLMAVSSDDRIMCISSLIDSIRWLRTSRFLSWPINDTRDERGCEILVIGVWWRGAKGLSFVEAYDLSKIEHGFSCRRLLLSCKARFKSFISNSRRSLLQHLNSAICPFRPLQFFPVVLPEDMSFHTHTHIQYASSSISPCSFPSFSIPSHHFT